jgi:hypothetical protein
MVASALFVAVGLLLCVSCLLAVLAISDVEMAGSEAIKRDGMPYGARAPRWTLTDSHGVIHTSPPDRPLQLVVFASHSLKSFPSVVDGLREIATETPDLEVVILLRQPDEIAEPVLAMLGLEGIPVLTGTESLYGRYNVRVSPWLIFVDSDGRVRASSLVNEAWQVTRLYRIATLPVDSASTLASRASGHEASMEV